MKEKKAFCLARKVGNWMGTSQCTTTQHIDLWLPSRHQPCMPLHELAVATHNTNSEYTKQQKTWDKVKAGNRLPLSKRFPSLLFDLSNVNSLAHSLTFTLNTEKILVFSMIIYNYSNLMCNYVCSRFGTYGRKKETRVCIHVGWIEAPSYASSCFQRRCQNFIEQANFF
jgi:hypothetical protein